MLTGVVQISRLFFKIGSTKNSNDKIRMFYLSKRVYYEFREFYMVQNFFTPNYSDGDTRFFSIIAKKLLVLFFHLPLYSTNGFKIIEKKKQKQKHKKSTLKNLISITTIIMIGWIIFDDYL